jgi:hypothetical protein
MRAHKLIRGATFEPEALKVIGQAFDDAWQEIAGNFGSDPQEIEGARLKFANAFPRRPFRSSSLARRAAKDGFGLPQSRRDVSPRQKVLPLEAVSNSGRPGSLARTRACVLRSWKAVQTPHCGKAQPVS